MMATANAWQIDYLVVGLLRRCSSIFSIWFSISSKALQVCRWSMCSISSCCFWKPPCSKWQKLLLILTNNISDLKQGSCFFCWWWHMDNPEPEILTSLFQNTLNTKEKECFVCVCVCVFVYINKTTILKTPSQKETNTVHTHNPSDRVITQLRVDRCVLGL